MKRNGLVFNDPGALMDTVEYANDAWFKYIGLVIPRKRGILYETNQH